MSNYNRNTLTGDLTPVNAELEKIENAIADQLDRKPAGGQANQMENILDMNSKRVINLPAPVDLNDAARLRDIGDSKSFADQAEASAQAAAASATAASNSETAAANSASAASVDADRAEAAANQAESFNLVLDPVVKTSGFTMESGKYYLIDTSGGVFDIVTPTPATADARVGFMDFAGTFDTNSATLKYAADKIIRLAEDHTLDLKNFAGALVYTGATNGWMYR